METVEVMSTKKEKPNLAIEDYLDFAGGQKNSDDLTALQLREILGMHGLKKMTRPKKDLTEVVNKIEPTNIDRSTLQDDGVSPCGCLTLEEVIKDLKFLVWNECHITSLSTLNASNLAASNRAVSVNKPKKARAAASVTTTGTSSAGDKKDAVSAKKAKKARAAASASASVTTTTGTSSSCGDKNDAVSAKKRKKALVAAPVSPTQAASSAGTKAAVSAKKKKKAGVASVTTTKGTTSSAGTNAAVSGLAASSTAGSTTKGTRVKLLHKL